MKIAFTGGGTIGHVAVNMALIPKALSQNIDCIYIGSKHGIEKDEITKQFPQIKYYGISSGKLRRYLSLENAKDIFRVQKGVLDALRVLKKEKPDIVFSKGGFVAVPVTIAAKILNIKTIIHESDVTPGLANKLALKFAHRLYTTFEETLRYVPAEKAHYVGSIIRDDLFSGDAQKGYDLTGFNPNKKVIMIMGGSLGSKLINQVIYDNLPHLLKHYQIIHLVGKGNLDTSMVHPGYFQREFVSLELMHLYKITDIVISRAGANALFEFLALQKPMILIPLGLDQSRGDQIQNAEIFEKMGVAKVIQEAELISDKLLEAIEVIEHQYESIILKMQQKQTTYTATTLLDKIIYDAK
ncbi:undecaprenyldiphospho-muramoylpentapeptide beta-N-acetylglucosaminyltransferase [Macrococcoides caseolyticum]|uniref:undecaprenyldiphospho-muramoylpentapeptide beta-N-acetylglucosaminyltransferase n=1 Tax=Macrococcoides caseolyticum TaxID=69966 RepID=UPI001F3B307B|nr:undecaprenyldiphospho-muramoylpentapeptide beta-N-acetylglucosaminyltransferase [Macrococcus caseolyticus]MCE4957015.1 undecaprenyldiphospho-muramoylpentapeptide beta-N-acetylglucosaminyltransferase [Macrococcus caseolyticus]